MSPSRSSDHPKSEILWSSKMVPVSGEKPRPHALHLYLWMPRASKPFFFIEAERHAGHSSRG